MKIKNLKNLKFVEYNTVSRYGNLDILENLEDMAYEVVSNWDGSSSCINTVFWEIADNYTPVYNFDIWENGKNILEYIEETIEELGGLIDGNLCRTFQVGICRYNVQTLNENIEELIINYCIAELDKLFDEVTDEQLKNKIANLQLDDVYEIVEGIDEDSRFLDITDAICKHLKIEEEESGE